MIRFEIDVATGVAKQISTTAYAVGGAVVLVDDGQPAPPGAVLASSMPMSAEVPPAKRFKSLEFLDLFTEAEQLAIVQASMQSATIKLWYDRALAASFVTISDPRVAAGLAALVDAELITEARRDEIVAAMSA